MICNTCHKIEELGYKKKFLLCPYCGTKYPNMDGMVYVEIYSDEDFRFECLPMSDSVDYYKNIFSDKPEAINFLKNLKFTYYPEKNSVVDNFIKKVNLGIKFLTMSTTELQNSNFHWVNQCIDFDTSEFSIGGNQWLKIIKL